MNLYWCLLCKTFRLHTMQTEELGRCVICNSFNYGPMGDIE